MYINDSRIKKLAIEFRKGIEQALVELQQQDQKFYRFPSGCCGDVSELLANYFFQKKISSTYVFGTKYGKTSFDSQSHAWLELGNGLIVDITADQFLNKNDYPQEYLSSCYVGKNNRFYNLFEVRKGDRKQFIGFNAYDKSEAERLDRLFYIICKYI